MILVKVVVFATVLVISASANTNYENVLMQRSTSKIFYNNSEITLADENGKPLDTYTYNDTTYVPLRAYSKSLDKSVQWDSTNGDIAISEMSAINNNDKEYGSYFKRIGIEDVSLVKLLANPQDYEGKKIRVSRIIQVDFEMDNLFLTREDCIFYNKANCIALNIRTRNDLGVSIEELETITTQFVTLEGTFICLYPEEKEWLIVDVNYINAEKLDAKGNIVNTEFGKEFQRN